MTIHKAVIAVAGLGSRFLPATKVVAKELLPILDKPVVQLLVEEVVESGIDEVVLVVRPGTTAIATHFQPDAELAGQINNPAIAARLERLDGLSQRARVRCVEQTSDLPYGNGSPLLAAREYLRPGDTFVFMFGDDLVLSPRPCAGQLIEFFDRHSPDAVIAVQNVPATEAERYGVVELKPGTDPMEVAWVHEKSARPPSTLAQYGRFLLPYRIVEILSELDVGKDNELWLTDALNKLCPAARVLAQQAEGTWFTTGDPLRFLIANIEYALRDAEIGPEITSYLKQRPLP